jgi:catechol 2,3-dioxygenase-like lactoylglutathione lyase family enzyme
VLPFYRDLLGLEVIPAMVDSPNVTWLQLADGAMIHPVEPRPDSAPPAYHVAFEVADFDAAVEAIETAGIAIERQGVRHDGQRYLFVRDPDGNPVELATRGTDPPADRVVDELGYTRTI